MFINVNLSVGNRMRIAKDRVISYNEVQGKEYRIITVDTGSHEGYEDYRIDETIEQLDELFREPSEMPTEFITVNDAKEAAKTIELLNGTTEFLVKVADALAELREEARINMLGKSIYTMQNELHIIEQRVREHIDGRRKR